MFGVFLAAALLFATLLPSPPCIECVFLPLLNGQGVQPAGPADGFPAVGLGKVATVQTEGLQVVAVEVENTAGAELCAVGIGATFRRADWSEYTVFAFTGVRLAYQERAALAVADRNEGATFARIEHVYWQFCGEGRIHGG